MNEKIKKGRESRVNSSVERYRDIIDAFLKIVNYYFINNPNESSKVFELPDYSSEFYEALKKVCSEEKLYLEPLYFSKKKVRIYIEYHYSSFDI